MDAARVSTGCGEGESAEAEARLADYIAGKRDPGAIRCRPAHEALIADVLSTYLDDVVSARKPAQTGAGAHRQADRLVGQKTVADVSPATCRDYAASRKREGPARPRGFARRHRPPCQPWPPYGRAEIELPEKGKARTRYFTRDEVARAIWYCWRHRRKQRPPRGARKGQLVESDFHDLRHIARFLLIGVYTGSRSTPILRASPYAAAGRAYVDLDSGLYYRLPEDFDEADTKRSPTLPGPRSPAGPLAAMAGQEAHAAVLRRVRRRAGEEHQDRLADDGGGRKLTGRPTPHTTRHTCVTWLKQAGIPSFEVAGFVGMSEAMVERVYGHHDPNFQHRARAALSRAR